MNDKKLMKNTYGKHGLEKLQDFSVYFEETPPTVFHSKWLKGISRKPRKFKLAR